MNLIRSIKDFFTPISSEDSKITIYLRRGTIDQIRSAKPRYVGEIVLCLDEPFIAIGAGEWYELIKIDPSTKAAEAIRRHYSEPEWMRTKPSW